MHNYICMWKITTTMQIIIIWIIKYFSLKFIPCRFYIWTIAKTKSLSHVLKKEYPNYEYAHEQVQHSSKLTLMMKQKKFTHVWNPNVRGVVSWFFYIVGTNTTQNKFDHMPLRVQNLVSYPLKTLFHSSSYGPNFTRLMFSMPNSHGFMKNFNIQWIIEYFLFVQWVYS